MHPVERELIRHAAALRGLARDLVGEHAADDLVQETAVQALRAGPARPGPLGGWLAGIVRHLAWRHRRTERRRQQREQLVARAEAVPPDREFDDRDAFQRLTAAVLALPEPYQRTVLLRYLRELSPTAIAAHTGEPLATVKTRLQRGLALLRERLDRDGGDTWRPALCTALGLDLALPVAAAATTTTGVVLMGTGAKLAWSSAAVLLALVAWLWSVKGPPATPPTSMQIAQAPVPASAADGNAAGTDANERSAATAAVTGVPADMRTVVRGRCVDEGGRPLTRCEVQLRGHKVLDRDGPDCRRAYGQWLVAHPGRTFRDAATTTVADGHFEFAFDFVPLAYDLRLRRDVLDHVVRIGAMQAGEAKDLGDVVLPVSCVLHGRVVDTSGAKVIAPVFVFRSSPFDPLHVIEGRGWSQCSPDGAFTAHAVVGEHDIYVSGREVVRGERLTVPAGCAQLDVEIVVAAVDPSDTISGVVVDEQGQPIEGARVMVPLERPYSTDSDAAGRFTCCRRRGSNDPVLLCVGESEQLVRWGTRDLRCVIARERSRDLELRVVAASDGTPVTDYRVMSHDDSGIAERSGGHHEQGAVALRGLKPGVKRLVVEPDRWDLWLQAVPLAPDSATPVEVRLPAARSRLLRVLRADGAPAVGVTVEQLQPGVADLGGETYAVPIEGWSDNGASALLLDRSSTDARGELSLHGPVDQAIALRLTGPPAMIVRDVRFDTDEPLVLTLPPVARLEGRLGPPALVRELREAAGLPAEGPAPPAGTDENARGFRLGRGMGHGAESVPPRSASPLMVAGDGLFVFDDVPEGRWTLQFKGPDGSAEFSKSALEPVQEVELVAGQTTQLAIELPGQLTGELAGQVVRNGVPWPQQEIYLRVAADEGRRVVMRSGTRTDADGRFHVRSRQGTARVLVASALALPGFGVWDNRTARDEVFVPAGGRVEQVFHIDTGTLRLRVVDADGRPQADVGLVLRGDDGRLHQTPCSGADGWLSAEVEALAFTVQALPRSIEHSAGRVNDWVVQSTFGAATADPFAGAWLDLGRVTAKPGATVECELRLPAAWSR